MSDTANAGELMGDVRPVIATGSESKWGVWAFAAILGIGGFVIFNALSASREAAETPSTLAPIDDPTARIASPAPLALPERFLGLEPEARPRREIAPPEPARLVRAETQYRSQPASQPLQSPQQLPQFLPPPPLPPLPPRVVFDSGSVAPSPSVLPVLGGNERVTAGRFQNPSYTIPQGTVIPAVLETALDSTRGGGVRALVQRDVSGFDGKRVLIPRGSRLYGQYEANLQRGQNRAQVQWTRLIRPDGVTIALDSPSSDPLGRAGVKGKVDSKFFQRFGNALLQSVLDIGVGLAVNSASDGVIVALPGSTQNVQVTDQAQILPTLKVRHGTSVSVFVARDLDFSGVES